MTAPAPSRALAFGCLALSMALVGTYVALARPLVAVFPVMLLAWLRFAIGAIATFRWIPGPPGDAPLAQRTHGLLFVESLLGNVLFTLFMLSGVRMTSTLSAGVILATIPAAVALLGRALLGERLAPRTVAAVACAAAGIALLAEDDGRGAAGDSAWVGNLLVLGAVLCEAAYAVIGKSLTGLLPPRRITALINLWGLVLVTPFGLREALAFDFGAVAPGHWALLVFYGLAASVWTVWLWMTGLRTVPATQAGVFTVMLPLAATAVGAFALGEMPGTSQWLALLLALAGIALASLPSPK